MRFPKLVPWKHESVGRVLSGHQLGEPSDVRQIISTHSGGFVYGKTLIFSEPFNLAKLAIEIKTLKIKAAKKK